jgi:hypothetical protein
MSIDYDTMNNDYEYEKDAQELADWANSGGKLRGKYSQCPICGGDIHFFAYGKGSRAQVYWACKDPSCIRETPENGCNSHSQSVLWIIKKKVRVMPPQDALYFVPARALDWVIRVIADAYESEHRSAEALCIRKIDFYEADGGYTFLPTSDFARVERRILYRIEKNGAKYGVVVNDTREVS